MPLFHKKCCSLLQSFSQKLLANCYLGITFWKLNIRTLTVNKFKNQTINSFTLGIHNECNCYY